MERLTRSPLLCLSVSLSIRFNQKELMENEMVILEWDDARCGRLWCILSDFWTDGGRDLA